MKLLKGPTIEVFQNMEVMWWRSMNFSTEKN